MHLGVGDYYSLSGGSYTKHANVEVIGVDSRQPYNALGQQTPSYFSEKQMKNESIIKQEEQMDYDMHESQFVDPKANQVKHSNAARLKDKEEVNSMYIAQSSDVDGNGNQCIYSCIATHTGGKKGNLKHRLYEMQKNNVKSQSQDSCCDDKNLYIELQKEKKLRMDLEKSYKNLLSEIHRNERYYSIDLNNEAANDHYQRRRQMSKRTLKEEVSKDRLSRGDQIRSPHSVKGSKTTEKKTTKLKFGQVESEQTPELLHSQQDMNEHEQAHYQIQKQQAQGVNQDTSPYRQTVVSQQSVPEYQDYFSQQREFQERMIETVEALNKKVEEIDDFLVEREHQREKEILRRRIVEKEEEIKKIQRENQQLRIKRELKKSVGEDKQILQGDKLDVLRNLSPNSLYFVCILLMVIVAIS